MKTEPIVFELMAETVLEPQPSAEDTHGSFGLEALAELIAEMDKEENQSLSCLEMVEALTASNIQVTTEEPILQPQVSSTKSVLPKKVSAFREAPWPEGWAFFEGPLMSKSLEEQALPKAYMWQEAILPTGPASSEAPAVSKGLASLQEQQTLKEPEQPTQAEVASMQVDQAEAREHQDIVQMQELELKQASWMLQQHHGQLELS